MMSEDIHKAGIPTGQRFPPAFCRYGPCRRNHALGSGGNLLDGCQEFDADPESSKICSACGCHRSFHIKVEDGKMDLQPTTTSATFPSMVPSSNLFAAVSPDSSREGHAGNDKTFGVALKGRKPCRSKQLRAKACQIWSEYLRPWASSQGINIRFCNTKDVCVSEMEKGEHSQCRTKCNQLKWPPLVPFTHPKDMASKELQQFINSYERDWQEYCLRNHGLASQASCSLVPRLRKDLDPCKVSTKELRYWLKENGKAVFCVHPKAANQFVNMGKLATMILRSGGKCKFEAANGWDNFVSSHEGMNKPALTTAERRKCVRTIKRLYNKFMMEFIQDTLQDMGLENDGELAMATVSDVDGANDDEDDLVDGDMNKVIEIESSNKQHQQQQQQQQLYLRDGGELNSSQRCLGLRNITTI